MKRFFVPEGSIVRKIWGRGETVLLIFAGASAEFALNKAVDWLYFTGRLPADPIGRLFSTVQYAQEIIFSEYDEAIAAIDKITAVHKGVEKSRGSRIPDAAYLDVLFMLIDYSIRSFELSVRKLSEMEKAELFTVFHAVGTRMRLKGLPADYGDWKLMRSNALRENLVRSSFTTDLYRQYLWSLGFFRYRVLVSAQALLVPQKVRQLLSLPAPALFYPALLIYKGGRFAGVDRMIKALLLPTKYKMQIAALDVMG